MSDPHTDSGHQCAAFGCPLPGARRGFGLGDGWWCFIHAHISCDLQATTALINANAHPLRMVLKVSNMAAHQWSDAGNQRYIADVLRRHGQDALIPTVEDRSGSPQAWAAKVRSALRAACFVSEKKDLAGMAETTLSEGGNPKSLREFFSGLHPADVA